MSKYIIEIEDEPFNRQLCLNGEEALYRAKGFKSLVFDKNGLEKLKPFDRHANQTAQEYRRLRLLKINREKAEKLEKELAKVNLEIFMLEHYKEYGEPYWW